MLRISDDRKKVRFFGTFFQFVHLISAVKNFNKPNFKSYVMKTLRPPYLFSVRLTLALTSALAVSAVNSQAQSASAQITGQSLGGGNFNYTLTLDNTGSSSLETFWFAWNIYDYDFMTVSPTSIVPASGWGDSVSINNGYGIEFTTSTSPLAAGHTLQFSFDSTMTPTQMSGNNPYWGYPVGTSYVSIGSGFSGSYTSFVAQVVPEPSSLALFAVGSFGLWIVRGRKHRNSAAA